MNFDYTEEQNMLKDSVARFVQDQYDFDSRTKVAALEDGFKREHWNTFAELGWLSVPFAEEHGGFGGSVVDNMMLMEEFGKGLVLEPFLATVVLFGGLLNKAGSAAQKDAHIGSIIEGSLQGAVAFNERQSRYSLQDVKTTAVKNGEGYLLNGEKTVVLNGMSADQLIVSARSAGEQSDQQGVTLLLVDASSAGIEKTAYRMMDGQVVANIRFNNVSVSTDAVIGEEGQGVLTLQSVIGEAIVAIGGEAVGIMDKLHTTTVEYTKTREQFGVAISSFQALQHRMVDMFMACEQTRSLVYRAACSVAGGSDEAGKDILALKVMIGRAGKLVGDEAFQIHGGIGMTDELDIGHYVKRLMMINTLFGDADFSQQKLAQLSVA